jgi:hypothetical protein
MSSPVRSNAPRVSPASACRSAVREVLLGYLHAHDAFPWPGADGLTLDEVSAAYPEAARLGRVPGPEQLCRQHPHLADAIAAFFAASAPAERPPAGN